MSRSYGLMWSKEKALEFLKVWLPDNIPEEVRDDEFCDEYQRTVNRVEYEFERNLPCKPRLQKGAKHIWDCGWCGSVIVSGENANYCNACGHPILWDEIRTLTGVKEGATKEVD